MKSVIGIFIVGLFTLLCGCDNSDKAVVGYAPEIEVLFVDNEGNVLHFDKDGKNVSALPFETDDKYYLIRMTLSEAERIIEDDDDYDDDGFLKDHVREEYEDKYPELEFPAEEEEEDEPMDEPEEDDDDEY